MHPKEPILLRLPIEASREVVVHPASGAKLSRAMPRRLRCDPNPEHLLDLLQAAVRVAA